MKLMNYTVKQTIHVDDADVERLIEEVYGVFYEIAAYEELHDCIKSYTVVNRTMYDHEHEDIEKVRACNLSHYKLGTILLDLCINGYLDEGEYIITV